MLLLFDGLLRLDHSFAERRFEQIDIDPFG